MHIVLDPAGVVINASDDPASHFHPDYAALFVDPPGDAPADLGVGWRFADGEWHAPAQLEPEPAPEPEPRALTYVEFVGLAMQAGQMRPAGYAAALTNPELILYFDLLKQAKGIRLDDPTMEMGAAAFISEGLIPAAGWDAMKAYWPTA